eukprot:6214798-Pleurochrysis_carterae.AAC.4
MLNYAAHLAGDDVFIVTDDVADYFPHLSLATTEYWFSTTSALRRRSTGSPLSPLSCSPATRASIWGQASICRRVCPMGVCLLYASKYAQRLSINLLAPLRFEFRHYRGKCSSVTLAWLHARKLYLGAHDALMHTALIYTDGVVLATIGADRFVALLRAWHKVTRYVGLTMAIPDKRQAGAPSSCG